MMKRLRCVTDEAIFITLESACKLTNLGRTTIRRLAEECKAARKVGKCYRINKEILLNYIDSFEA